MEISLREALNMFKEYTEKLIEALKLNDFNKLEELFLKRQSSIDNMNDMSYTKDEFSKICTALKIMELDNQLSKLMNEKRVEVRDEITKISHMKSANKSYNKQFSVDAIYFNKKI